MAWRSATEDATLKLSPAAKSNNGFRKHFAQLTNEYTFSGKKLLLATLGIFKYFWKFYHFSSNFSIFWVIFSFSEQNFNSPSKYFHQQKGSTSTWVDYIRSWVCMNRAPFLLFLKIAKKAEARIPSWCTGSLEYFNAISHKMEILHKSGNFPKVLEKTHCIIIYLYINMYYSKYSGHYHT